MNNTTYSVKKSEIERKWYIIDAADKPLGRVATEAARLLAGKHKAIYSTNIDTGDHVIVINCDQVKLTGNKLNNKIYYDHSGYTGGLRERTAKEMKENYPVEMIERAVKGMIPHTRLGRKVAKKLFVYEGSEHPHTAQKPEVLEVK